MSKPFDTLRAPLKVTLAGEAFALAMDGILFVALGNPRFPYPNNSLWLLCVTFCLLGPIFALFLWYVTGPFLDWITA